MKNRSNLHSLQPRQSPTNAHLTRLYVPLHTIRIRLSEANNVARNPGGEPLIISWSKHMMLSSCTTVLDERPAAVAAFTATSRMSVTRSLISANITFESGSVFFNILMAKAVCGSGEGIQEENTTTKKKKGVSSLLQNALQENTGIVWCPRGTERWMADK